MSKVKIIKQIRARILTEQAKHRNQDWAMYAAIKIYSTLNSKECTESTK